MKILSISALGLTLGQIQFERESMKDVLADLESVPDVALDKLKRTMVRTSRLTPVDKYFISFNKTLIKNNKIHNLKILAESLKANNMIRVKRILAKKFKDYNYKNVFF